MFKNMKLRTRIMMLSLCTVAIGAIASVALLLRLDATQQSYEQVLGTQVAAMEHAREMQVTFKKQVQEWKNVLIRGADAAAFDKHVDGFLKEEASVRAMADSLTKEMAQNGQVTQLLVTFKKVHGELGSKYGTAIQQFAKDRNAKSADGAVKGLDRPPTDMIDSLVTVLQSDVAERGSALKAQLARERAIAVVLLLISYASLIVASLLLVRTINARLQRVVARARELREKDMREIERAGMAIAAGDVNTTANLTVQPLVEDRNDELGELAAALDGMIDGAHAVSGAVSSAQQALRSVLEALAAGITAARSGELDHRVGVAGHHGAYGELASGMNSLLTAVASPISALRSALEKVAARDLTARAPHDYKGEYGRLAAAMNTAVANLETAMQEVTNASAEVASASSQISDGSNRLASGASEQASSLEEVNSSLQEMSSMSRRNAQSASEARTMTESAVASVNAGAQGIRELSQAVERIQASSAATARIVKTIDEIAFQTNLLALNAAVEAARAGDSGKGFAVVAEEVRALALRSAEAARNTADLIEQGVRSADEGVTHNASVLNRLQEIQTRIQRVTEVIGEIASASEQQREGVLQITAAVDQMNNVTQEVAAQSEESAATAEELHSQAESLRQLVEQFEVGTTRAAIAIPQSRHAALRRDGMSADEWLGPDDSYTRQVA